MAKSRTKKKYLLTILICVIALCACAFAFFGFSSDPTERAAGTTKLPTASDSHIATDKGPVVSEDGSTVYYTFGETYHLGGIDRTIDFGDGKADDYVRFAEAFIPLEGAIEGFRLADYSLAFKQCIRADGSDVTGQTGGIRRAGTYTFELTPIAGGSPITKKVICQQARINIDVNKLGYFGNTSGYTSTGHIWEAHGDITTIYLLDTGWYDAQIYETINNQLVAKTVVEKRVISNSYYAAGNDTKHIMIDGEYDFDGAKDTVSSAGCHTPAEGHEAASTSKYDFEGFTLEITDRKGVAYKNPGQYAASFTFNIPSGKQNDYKFDYSDESRMTDSYKGLEINNDTKTDHKFELHKVWYVINSETKLGQLGLLNGSEPYVPFTTEDGKGADTFTYGDEIYFNEPMSSFLGNPTKEDDEKLKRENNTLLFTIEYMPLGSKVKEKIVTDKQYEYSEIWWNTGGNNWSHKSNTITDANREYTLAYYFNSSMPTGTYILTITSRVYEDSVLKKAVTGIYTMYVVPAEINAGAIAKLGKALNGEYDDEGNFFTISAETKRASAFHVDISDAKKELEGTLNDNVSGTNYWSAIVSAYNNNKEDAAASEAFHKYYGDTVTIEYRRSTDGITSYTDYDNMLNNYLTSAGKYTLYFSVAAKNYATAGGAEDENRNSYSFTTSLFEAIDIYGAIRAKAEAFHSVEYTGSAVTTTVPGSAHYSVTDTGNYINVGYGYVTLTLHEDVQLYGWGDIPEDLTDWAEIIDADRRSLRVKFEITPATNSWTVPPSITSWLYQNYNSEVNTVSGTPKFQDENLLIYYRLGKVGAVNDKETGESAVAGYTYTDDDNLTWIYDGSKYSWLDVGGSLTPLGDSGIGNSAFFAVGENGAIAEDAGNKEVTSKLNLLHVGGYALDSYIGVSRYVDDDDDGNKIYNVLAYHTAAAIAQVEGGSLSTVTVLKGYNSWDTAPGMTGWTYNDFSDGSDNRDSNFVYGVPTFANTVTYELHKGNATGDKLITFASLEDGADEVTGLGDYETVAEYLDGLGVGQYTIIVTVAGSDDYYVFDTTLVTFSVSQAANTWNDGGYPSITSWVYNQFKASNITVGSTRFDETCATAQYTIQYITDADSVATGSDGKPVVCGEENMSYEALVEALETLSATHEYGSVGRYRILVNVPAADNYLAASQQELRFTVSKADYRWKNDVTPTIEPWEYGKPANEPSETGVDVVYYVGEQEYRLADKLASDENLGEDEREFKIVYTYYNTTYYNNNYTRTTVVDNIAEATVGTYMLVATVSYYTDNYNVLESEYIFAITVGKNDWLADEKYRPVENDTVTWTWGWADGTSPKDTALVNATAIDMIAGIVYNITKTDGTYTGSVTVKNGDTERTELLKELKGLGIGNYSVLINVPQTPDHDSMQTQMFITVNPADFVVNTPPAVKNGGWTWGDGAEAKQFTAAVVDPVEGKEDDKAKIKYVYSITVGTGTAAETYEDDAATVPQDQWKSGYEKMVAALIGRATGTYTVTVSVSCENYNSKSFTFTVKIAKAEFTGTDGPTDDVTLTWGDDLTTAIKDVKYDAIPESDRTTLVAKYVVFDSGAGNEVDDHGKMIDKLKELGVGTYTVAITVTCDNYETLYYSIEVTIDPADFEITEPDKTEWTWGDDDKDKTVNDIKVGVKYEEDVVTKRYRIGDTAGTSWSDTYTGFGEMRDALKKYGAGEYKVEVSVSCANYNSDIAYIYVTVNKAHFVVTSAPIAGGETETSIGWAWGDDIASLIPDLLYTVPTGESATKTYSLISGTTTDNSAASYGAFIAKLAELGRGEYTVEFTVELKNYESLKYTIHVTVSDATITVSSEHKSATSWTWGAGKSAIEGEIPDIKYSVKSNDSGKEKVSYSIITDGSSTENVEEGYDKLIELLMKKGVGHTYTVVITVTCDHYVTVTKTTTVTVNAATIAVTSAPKTSPDEWTWGAYDVIGQKFPEGFSYSVLAGDTATAAFNIIPEVGLTNGADNYADFITNLRKTGVGKYTIEIVITCPNYTPVEYTFGITVKEATFGITDPGVDGDGWTWGAKDRDKKVHGIGVTTVAGTGDKATIVYSIISGGGTYTYRDDGEEVEGEKKTAYDKMLADLIMRGVGTYTVEVSVTCANYKPVTRSVVVTVTPAKLIVTDGSFDNDGWTWGDAENLKAFNDIKVEFVIANDANDTDYDYRVMQGTSTLDSFDTATAMMAWLKNQGVGSYQIAIYITSPNYGAEISYASLTIKAAKFTDVTEGSCDGWTWGAGDSLKSFTDVTAETRLSGDTVKKTYRISSNGGESWAGPYDYNTMFNNLKGYPAGEHIVEITLSCDNYETEIHTVTVNIAYAKFTVIKHGDVTWKWEDKETDKTFADIEVTPAAIAKKSYSVSSDDGANWTNERDSLSAFLDVLRGFDAGEYIIKVTVSGANYETTDTTFTLTISRAKFRVFTYGDVSWTWDADEKTFDDIRVEPAEAANKSYRISENGGLSWTDPYTEFNAVLAALKDKNVGDYKLEITITNKNYDTETRTITVSVKEGTIEVTNKSSYNSNVSWKWGAGKTAIEGLIPEPTYTVKTAADREKSKVSYAIRYGASTESPADYDKLIARLIEMGVGTFTVQITITCDNYKTETVSVDVEVKSATLTVSEGSVDGGGWTWGEANRASKFHTPTVSGYDASIDKLVVEYRIITKTGTESFVDDGAEVADGKSAYDKMIAALIVKPVGTYQVVIIVSCANYESVTKYVSVAVSEARFVNPAGPGKTAKWTWGAGKTVIEGQIPAVKYGVVLEGDASDVSVSYGISTGASFGDYPAFTGRLAELNAGSYTVTITISHAYYITETFVVALTIDKASFTVTGPSGSVEWTTGASENDIKALIPDIDGDKPSDTTVTYYIYEGDSGSPAGGYDGMISRLYSSKVGTFTVVITLSRANYNDKEFTVAVEIKRIANAWDSNKLEDLGGVESVDTSSFKVPSATITSIRVGGEEVEILRFDIIAFSGQSSYNLTRTEFTEALGTLANGTFTVYARLGGTGYYNPDEKLSAALAIYNESYTILEPQSCIIALSVKGNSWTRRFTGGVEWTWGVENERILALTDNRPIAADNDEMAEYSIRQGGDTLRTFRAADPAYEADEKGTAAEKAWAALLAYVVGIDAGAYSITAYVPPSGEYGMAPMISETFTIKKLTTVWDTATTERNNTKTYKWDYEGRAAGAQKVDADKPVIGTADNLRGTWGKTVNYTLAKVGGSQVYGGTDWDSVIDALKDENRTEGSYTLTAFIAEGNSHTSLTYTVTITVTLTENKWETDSTNGERTFSWVYGDDNKKDGKNIIDLVPKYNGDKLKLSVSGTAVVLGSQTVAEYLATLGAGEYKITVSVDADDKYDSLSVELTLTVKKAANRWVGEDTVTKSITWVYNSNANASISLSNEQDFALTYTVNGAPVVLGRDETITAYLAKLAPNDETPYTVIATAADPQGNYETITFTITLLYQKAENTWSYSNISENKIDWTYNEAKTVTLVPAHGDKVTYSVGNTAIDVSDWQGDINNYFKTLGFGTHSVRVTVEDSEGKYRTFTYDFTITVARAQNKWASSSTVSASITWIYGSSDNTQIKFMPEYTGSKLTYSINGTDIDLNGYTDINDYLSRNISLGTAEYTIKVTVERDDYYEELTHTFTFVYNFSVNEWTEDSTVSKTDYEWVYGEDHEEIILKAKFLNDRLTVSHGTQSVVLGNLKTINAYLDELPVGDYRITVTVEDVQHHYNTLTFEFTVKITKKTNAWEGNVSDSQEIVWRFGEEHGDVVLSPKYIKNNLIVTSNGDTVSLSDGYTLNDYLKSLPYGDTVYTIHARVDDDGNHTAISLTFTFKKLKAANSWIKGGSTDKEITWTFEDWTYGEDGAKKAKDIDFEAKELNGNLVFTRDGREISMSGYDTLGAYLMTLGEGTYTITAEVVDKAGQYENISFTFTLTVKKAKNVWDKGSGLAGRTVEWKFDGDNETVEIEPLYKKGDLVIKFNGATVGTSLATYLASLPYGDTSYAVEATVAEDEGHTGLSLTFTFKKLRADNYWIKNVNDGETISNWVYGEEHESISLEPKYCASDLVLTVGGKAVSLGRMTVGEYLDTLGAGTHAVVAEVVDSQGHYADIRISFTLIIEKAANSLGAGYSFKDSFEFAGKDGENVWHWGTSVSWKKATPKYGENIQIFVTNTKTGGMRSFSSELADTDKYNAMIGRLNDYFSGVGDGALGVGKYTMRILIISGDNWKELDLTEAFEIIPAKNGWTDEHPEFISLTPGEGLGSTQGGKNETVYKWTYGKAVGIRAPSIYGTYKVVYWNTDTNKTIAELPTDAGNYKAVFTVDADETKYEGIDAYTLIFTIEKASGFEYGFDKTPSVSGWAWNGYDVNSNLFTGRPKSGGEISFVILDENGDTVVVPEFNLVNANNSNGTHTGSYDADIYAPIEKEFELNGKRAKLSAFLNALTEGDYTLRMIVGATANYDGFTVDETFSVRKATNAWLETPKIASWHAGGFDPKNNAPKAEVLYGDYTVIIAAKTGENTTGAEWYNVRYTYDETTGKHTGVGTPLSNLNAAEIGWYVLTVTVEGREGKFDGMKETVDFQVFAKGTDSVSNYWVETPGISNWTANVEGKVNFPTGEPARGKTYFVFYRAVWNGNGYTQDENPIGKDDESVMVEDYGKHSRPYYIPQAPGTYLMYAYAVNESVPSGEDDLASDDFIVLTIYEREIKWEQSVSIAKTMYLGQQNIWDEPTSATNIDDDETLEVEYVYYDADDYDHNANPTPLGKMPTTAGTYYVKATAYAKFTNVITSTARFTIERSRATWETAVTIAPVLYLGVRDTWVYPTATVSKAGITIENAEISVTYEFFDAATGKSLGTEIPAVVGSYYVVATATADFMETITSSMDFSVEKSKNFWVGASPDIDDWKEDTSSKNPTGEAFAGKITYKYIDKKTGKVYDKKPTKAGTYILVATVEEEGYETLEARSEFTIEPAYDMTFLTIDVILGTIACAFAVVVIIFAVRRYKEN
ncbi:MAG: hypothetical protein J1G38_04150 [Clostridiales bacterium]|nr:hypothetical protein [Clostridiales bacterium]